MDLTQNQFVTLMQATVLPADPNQISLSVVLAFSRACRFPFSFEVVGTATALVPVSYLSDEHTSSLFLNIPGRVKRAIVCSFINLLSYPHDTYHLLAIFFIHGTVDYCIPFPPIF